MPPIALGYLLKKKVISDTLLSMAQKGTSSKGSGKTATKRYSRKKGLPPGTLVYTGSTEPGASIVSVTRYSEKIVEEITPERPEFTELAKAPEGVYQWVNIQGTSDVTAIEQIGRVLNLNRLHLEDAVNSEQRPKTESFDDTLFVVLKLVLVGERTHPFTVRTEQISLFLKKNMVVSLQERREDAFALIRPRLQRRQATIRALAPEQLFITLIDVVIDHYFSVIDAFATEIEELEVLVTGDPPKDCLARMNRLRNQLIHMRKNAFPTREVILQLTRYDQWFSKESQMLLRDVLDHALFILETLDNYRELLDHSIEVYLTHMSQKTNEIMKILTVIATIFTPMTFVVGLYGMNFHHMPEYEWRWGYAFVWVILLGTALLMLAFLRKKKWL